MTKLEEEILIAIYPEGKPDSHRLIPTDMNGNQFLTTEEMIEMEFRELAIKREIVKAAAEVSKRYIEKAMWDFYIKNNSASIALVGEALNQYLTKKDQWIKEHIE
jgi:hypothetical protein